MNLDNKKIKLTQEERDRLYPGQSLSQGKIRLPQDQLLTLAAAHIFAGLTGENDYLASPVLQNFQVRACREIADQSVEIAFRINQKIQERLNDNKK